MPQEGGSAPQSPNILPRLTPQYPACIAEILTEFEAGKRKFQNPTVQENKMS